MRAVLIGCVVAAVVAIGGAYVLDLFQKPSAMMSEVESVRLPDHVRG
jgi:hypothetical protein